MSDFNFFLNRQGIQGRKGDKGDAGFTPTISVSEQTLNSYKLKITNEYNEFETPNLIGNLGVTDNGGTYLRYDPATGTVSTGEIDGATTEVVGGVRKSTDADLTNLSADTAVTPANVADMLPLLLEAGTDNVTITQDETTSKTKISVEGGGGSGDVTAAGDNRFTGDNTFTGKVNIAGGALTVDGVANLNQATAQYLNAVSITSSGEVNAVSIKANGLRSDDIQTTENKKYLTELDVDNQTIQVVNGKLHANLDELGNEVNSLSGEVTNLTGRVTNLTDGVNSLSGKVTSLTGDVTDLTGRVTVSEADISAMKTGKQNKLTAGDNVTLTDLTDGTVRIDATGGGGATIDDSTIATTSVWSSSKTNTEISTVANEVVQVQGDIASLDGDVSTLKTDVSTLKTDVSGLDTDVSGIKTDVSGLKTDVSGLKTSKQNTLVSGTNIKTINGETILGEGDITVGGSTPANMVTTDTTQTITGVKTFEDLKIKDLNAGGSTEMYANNGLVVTNNGENTIIFRNTSYLETRHGEYASTATMKFGEYDAPSSAQKISSCANNGSGSYGNLILEANSNTSDKSSLKLTKDSLTFTASDGTVTNLLTGGGGSAPTNMVTTDTDQTITGKKVFSNFGQYDAITFEYTGSTSRPKGFIGMDANNSGGLISLGVDYNSRYGANMITVGSNISIGSEPSRRGVRFYANESGLQDCHLVMGNTSSSSSIGFLNSSEKITLNPYSGGHLDVGSDSLTFTKKDGTSHDLLASGSAPTNMVTTDTAQDITANKTFYGEIRVGADNNYATLAKFSKEALAFGDSTLLEHIDLGEATFVVQGNLGKKVYETDKYVYKKYINVDDLSDNQIAMDNSISSQVAHMAMPSNKYIDLTLGASGTKYTAPADGYVVIRRTATAIGQFLQITSSINAMQLFIQSGISSGVIGGYLPVKKDGEFTVSYTLGSNKSQIFRFVYSVGSEPTQ